MSYIKVKVTADAKKESIKKLGDGKFVVSVHEEAKENRANRRVIEIFEQYFKARGKVSIKSGHHRPNKMIFINLP